MLELIVAAMVFASFKLGRAVERFSQEQAAKNPEPETQGDLPYYNIYVEGDEQGLYAYSDTHKFITQATGYQELIDKIGDIKGSCVLNVHLVGTDWKKERP